MVKAVKYNKYSYLNIEDLWQALHSSFNIAQNQQIDIEMLEEILSICALSWALFSKKEFISSITKYNNFLTLRLNKLLQKHLKCIIKNKGFLSNIVNIANTCFELGHWPSHFKTSITIIIPKPNKELYNTPKAFRSIIFLNTPSKLIKKIIGNCLQFHVISNNFIHLC